MQQHHLEYTLNEIGAVVCNRVGCPCHWAFGYHEVYLDDIARLVGCILPQKKRTRPKLYTRRHKGQWMASVRYKATGHKVRTSHPSDEHMEY